jgi:hypothetical protein
MRLKANPPTTGAMKENRPCYSGSVEWSTCYPIESPCFPMLYRCTYEQTAIRFLVPVAAMYVKPSDEQHKVPGTGTEMVRRRKYIVHSSSLMICDHLRFNQNGPGYIATNSSLCSQRCETTDQKLSGVSLNLLYNLFTITSRRFAGIDQEPSITPRIPAPVIDLRGVGS